MRCILTLNLLLVASPALAAGPHYALHVDAPVAKACASPVIDTPCTDFVYGGGLGTTYSVYVLVVDGPPSGVLGGRFSVHYTAPAGDGIDITGWTGCGTQFPGPGWPASGASNIVDLGACSTATVGSEGPRAILGAFTLSAYDPDFLEIRGPGADLTPLVVDCTIADVPAPNNPIASFGFGGVGNNPCLGVADFFPGPCCVGESCTSQRIIECTWQGGTFLGLDGTCQDCAVVDADSPTWGRIKSRHE